MKVLIGCERFGVIRRAFAARGHLAFSVDLAPAADADTIHRTGSVHVVGDVFETLRADRWDLFIVHPECTFLCSSGLHWNRRRPGRADLTQQAVDFAVRCWEEGKRHAKGVVLENPRGRLGPVMLERFGIRAQTIQPNQFGDDASKATCLFLHGVPPLRPTALAPPRRVGGSGADLLGEPLGTPRWANQTDSGQNKLAPSARRSMDRARSYPGVAAAMADQWGRP